MTDREILLEMVLFTKSRVDLRVGCKMYGTGWRVQRFEVGLGFRMLLMLGRPIVYGVKIAKCQRSQSIKPSNVRCRGETKRLGRIFSGRGNVPLADSFEGFVGRYFSPRMSLVYC